MRKCKFCQKYLYTAHGNRTVCERCSKKPQANTNREEWAEIKMDELNKLRADSEDLKLIKEQLKSDCDHDQAIEWLKKKYGEVDQ